MRSFLLTGLVTFFLQTLSLSAQQPAGEQMLQPGAMQEDFSYLRKTLEETHPGLYKHHTQAAMQYKMDSLYQQLVVPLPFWDFYKKIAYLIAEVKCEHSYCNFRKMDSLVAISKLLPLQLYFTENKAFITVNRTRDTSIHFGDELLSVNGYPIDSIKRELYKYIPADGYMTASKDHQLSSLAFNIWYYFFIERPDSFNIVIKNKKGELLYRHWDKELILKENTAITLKNPANKEVLALDKKGKKLNKNPWRLEILKEKNAAIMTIQTFTGDKVKFFKTIDQFFTTLQEKHIDNLILDISNNGGGDEEYAAELMSYLIDKPTRFMESEYLMTDSDYYIGKSDAPDEVKKNKYEYIEPLKDGKSYAKLSQYSQELKTMEPKSNRFIGNLYFFVSGITSSAASTFAAVAQSNQLGIIVGEETAGSFAGGGTVIGLNLTLPNSKIKTHTSIVYQVFATGGHDGDRGVIPDHPFTTTFNDLVNGNNGWKNYILGLIK